MFRLVAGPGIKRHHVCSVCGHVAPWGPDWQWYGSERDIDEGNPITKVCSEACRKKAPRGRVREEANQ